MIQIKKSRSFAVVQWRMMYNFNLLARRIQKSITVTTTKKSLLKLVQLHSFVAKCCKIQML